jgi:hypothetical protein
MYQDITQNWPPLRKNCLCIAVSHNSSLSHQKHLNHSEHLEYLIHLVGGVGAPKLGFFIHEEDAGLLCWSPTTSYRSPPPIKKIRSISEFLLYSLSYLFHNLLMTYFVISIYITNFTAAILVESISLSLSVPRTAQFARVVWNPFHEYLHSQCDHF